jgi:hypothetical protein
LKPKIILNKDLPEIGIPFDPICIFLSYKILIGYEIPPSKGEFAILIFEDIIEFKITPVNDQGIGSHRFAKDGLTWYSIHEVTQIDETEKWKVLKPIYWIFTFKDRTIEVLGSKPLVIQSTCSKDIFIQEIDKFTRLNRDHLS